MTRPLIPVWLLGLSFLFFGSTASAGTGEAVGRVTYIEGRVDRADSEGALYFPVVREEEISEGDTVRTKSFSRAEITFADKSVLRIGENTQVRVKDYTLDAGSTRKNAHLFVERGKIRAIVSKAKKGPTNFYLSTPNSVGSVKGSDIFVAYQRSSTTFLAVTGEIHAASPVFPEQEIMVSRGHTSLIPHEAPPMEPRPFLSIERKRLENETNPAFFEERLDKEGFAKAVVSRYSGNVRIRSKGTKKWHAVALKESLGVGDEIETGPDGKIEIVLESGRVVNLKPNSHLLIRKLSLDLKRDKREDLLESLRGQIRAQIEKSRRESKLEIRTPVAVAAVRGTTLYLYISPDRSSSFFEGGNGSLTSLINKAMKLVNAGQNASSDSQGNLTGPFETTDDQREELGEGWDPDGDYGYSEPEGGEAPGEPYTGGGEETPPVPGEDQGPFDNIPQEISSSPDGGGAAGLPGFFYGLWGMVEEEGGEGEGEGEEEGSLYYNNSGNIAWAGEESGPIFGIPPWASPEPFSVAGEFSDIFGGEVPLIWNTSLFSHNFPAGGEEHSDATPDGGALRGFTAGIWNNNTLEGSAATLYHDPLGNMGLLTSENITGIYDPLLGTWSAAGIFTPTVLGFNPEVDPDHFSDHVHEGSIAGYFAGDFDGQGYLTGWTYSGTTLFMHHEMEGMQIPSEPWGIYDLKIGNDNTYYNPNWDAEGPTNWSGVVGGDGSFGHFYPYWSEGQYFTDDSGYWVAEAAGTWEDREIRGDLLGAYLTYTQLGVFGGPTYGLFDTSEEGFGTWILESVGPFLGTPLSFFSQFDSSLDLSTGYYNGSYYYNNELSSSDSSYYYSYYGVNSGYTYFYDFSQYYSPNYTYGFTYATYNPDGSYSGYFYQNNPYQFYYFSGRWDEEHSSLSFLAEAPEPGYYNSYNNFSGSRYGDGSLSAYLGGTESLWSGPDPVSAIAIGYFGNGSYDYLSDRHIWIDGFYSYNYLNGTYTTYDGGAYYAYLGGTHESPNLHGLLVGLYIAPDRSAGYLFGEFDGTSFEEIRMFSLEGEITREEVVSDIGIEPEGFYDAVQTGGGDGNFAGSFPGGGFVEGEDDLQTTSIVDYENEVAQPWGIYSQVISGTFSNPEGDTTWSGLAGGNDSFGVYNPTWYNYAQYYYPDGGSYYFYYYQNDTNSYVNGYQFYYRPDGPYYYTQYYDSGTTYSYNYRTGSSSYGTWDPSSQQLSDLVGTPPDSENAQFSYGDRYGTSQSDEAYWMAEITEGTWNELTAELDGIFLSRTKLGTLSGDILGIYNNEENTWAAVGLGTWEGEPLAFFSEFDSSLDTSTRYHYGNHYDWDQQLYYSYSFYGNNASGNSYYQDFSQYAYPQYRYTITSLSYQRDGTYSGYTYTFYYTNYPSQYISQYENLAGQWDVEGGLSFLSEPPFENPDYSVGDSYASLYDDGSINAYLGGTESLWAGEDPVPALMLGSFQSSGDYDFSADDHIFSDNIVSRNYLENNYTTYDGGAYYGFLGGVHHHPELEALLVALYIDPEQGAGFLFGDFSGTHFEEIEMFRMDGLITREEVVSEIGILPEDLFDSLSTTEGDGELVGSFSSGGFIEGTDSFQTVSLVDYENGVAEPWGIYLQEITGTFSNPEGDTVWSGHAAGNDSFGVYDPTWQRSGQYYYYPEGSYDGYYYYYYYEDYTFDYTSGYQFYYRPNDNGPYTYTQYYRDGTTFTYNYRTGSYSYGTWDPSSDSLAELVGNPPDSEDAQLSYTNRDGVAHDDEGYWLADITEGTWNSVTAALSGTFLTLTKMGTLSGEILGIFNNDENAWAAVGLGTWEGSPLSVSGYWGDNSLYYNDGGYVSGAGSEYGLIGSTSPDWTTDPFPFVAMGQYYEYGYDTAYLWNTPVSSYDILEGDYSTLDNQGAFSGFTGGIWKDETLDGTLVALYLDSEGNAGFLTGDVSGSYFQFSSYGEGEGGTGFWQVEGILTPTQMSSGLGLDPDTFSTNYEDAIHEGWLDAAISGDFEGEGYLWGESDWGDTQFIHDMYSMSDSEPWGIFDLKLGNENTYSNPSGATLWSAVLGWEGVFGHYYPDWAESEWDYYEDWGYWIAEAGGSWENGEIRGELLGQALTYTRLYEITGDVFGLYDTGEEGFGTWIAESLGTYTGEELSFSGYWGENGGGDSLYSNDGGDLSWAGDDFGFIGSTTPNWWTDPFPFLAMGEFWLDVSEDTPLLWNSPIYSYDAVEGDYSTLDNQGAFSGFTGGIWKDGTLDGAAVALYLDPDGNAGFLTGNVSGSYYSDPLWMWLATGVLTPTQMASSLGISPESFSNYIHQGLHSYGHIGLHDVYHFGPHDLAHTDWHTGEHVGSHDGNHISPHEFEHFGSHSGSHVGPHDGTHVGPHDFSHTDLSDLDHVGFHSGLHVGPHSGNHNARHTLSHSGQHSGLHYESHTGNHTDPVSGEQHAGNHEGWHDSSHNNDHDFTHVALHNASHTDEHNLSHTEYHDDIVHVEAHSGYHTESHTGFHTELHDLSHEELHDFLHTDEHDGFHDALHDLVHSEFHDFPHEDLHEGSHVDYHELTHGGLEGSLEGMLFGAEGTGLVAGGIVPDLSTTVFLHDDPSSASQPWGIFDIKFGVENSFEGKPEGAVLWTAAILDGIGVFGHLAEEEDIWGGWVGVTGGVWNDGKIHGPLVGLYLTEIHTAGISVGNFFGLYEESGEGSGTWIGESLGTYHQMAEGVGIDPSDLFDELIESSFSGLGSGSFEGGGTLDALVEGIRLNLTDQDWGIWTAGLEGSFGGETSPFRLALGGEIFDGSTAAWLGTLAGEWEDPEGSIGEFSGEFKGIWISESAEDQFTAGSVTGEAVGTYDPEGGSWEAIGIGEWVTITELDAAALGYNMEDLTSFVEIPITEVYSSLLDVAGSFNGGAGAITGTMDASFYGNTDSLTSGIWAALLEGSYTGLPEVVDSWEAAVTGSTDLGDVTAHLHGTEWSNGEWLADVHVHDSPIGIVGQAGGTYTPADSASGTFEGVGTGTWEVSPA